MSVYSDLKDPHVKGHDLLTVSRHRGGDLRPVSRTVPPTTYYRVGAKSNKLKCMVTIMPNGLHVAWDFCGTCSLGLHGCTCHHGPTAPRHIEYMYGPYKKGKDAPAPQPVKKTLLKAEKVEPKSLKTTKTVKTFPPRPVKKLLPHDDLPPELRRTSKQRKSLAHNPSLTEVDAVAGQTAEDLLNLALRRTAKATKPLKSKKKVKGKPAQRKPGDPQCDQTTNPGVWPFTSRCLYSPGHKGDHEDKYGNKWSGIKPDKPAGKSFRR